MYRHGFAWALLAGLAWPGVAGAQSAPGSIPPTFAVVRHQGTLSCGIDRPLAVSAEGMLPDKVDAEVLSRHMGLAQACQKLRKASVQLCPLWDDETVEVCKAREGVVLPQRWAAMRAPASPSARLVPLAGWQSQALLEPPWQRLWPGLPSRPPADAPGGSTPLSHVVRCPDRTVVGAQSTLPGWDQLPFVLRVKASGGAGTCMATQLSGHEILTAAHCLPAGGTAPSQLTVVQAAWPATVHDVQCGPLSPASSASVVCRLTPALPCPHADTDCQLPAVAPSGSPMPAASAMLVLGWSIDGQPQAHCIGTPAGSPGNSIDRSCEALPPDAAGVQDMRGWVSQACRGGAAELLFLSDVHDSGAPLFAGCQAIAPGEMREIEGMVQRTVTVPVEPHRRMLFSDFRCPLPPS
jgi:hypothetical protein